jgi:hypothetical protein
MNFFEATKEQKILADTGRAMMDYSENYGKLYGLKAVTDNKHKGQTKWQHVQQ